MRLDVMVTAQPDGPYGEEAVLRHGVSVSVPGTEGVRAGGVTAAQIDILLGEFVRRLDQVSAGVRETLADMRRDAAEREAEEVPSA